MLMKYINCMDVKVALPVVSYIFNDKKCHFLNPQPVASKFRDKLNIRSFYGFSLKVQQHQFTSTLQDKRNERSFYEMWQLV